MRDWQIERGRERERLTEIEIENIKRKKGKRSTYLFKTKLLLKTPERETKLYIIL